jgi:hypothetical protein
MRISPMPRVCPGLILSALLVLAGCSNPSSQSLVSLSVTASPASVSVGGASVMRATAHLSDGTTQDVSSGTQWTVSNPALATIANGALTAKAAGTVTVQAAYVEAAPAGNSPAAATTAPQALTASTQVTINAPGTVNATNVPAVSWNTPTAITYGTALSSAQLNATASVPGTFAYTPASGTVLTAGTQTLSVTFMPSNTSAYSAATASVQLSVAQATPVLTWAAPAPITVGTALSSAQLNAVANAPGTFQYSPAVGNVPAAGVQSLTAVFTPTDATDYASATTHTSLTVNTAANPTPTPTPTPTPAPTPTPTPTPITGLPTPVGCGGPTINLNNTMSQSTLQSTISSAPACSLIVFAPGTYNITGQLGIPCNSLQITGPVAATPTAILAASFQNGDIFVYGGNCTNAGSVNYLHFENTGGVYFSVGNNGNFTFQYNQVTNLPSNASNSSSESGLFFDGSMSTTLSNVLVQHNTIGDANSCTSVFATSTDEGGYCAGILTAQGKVQSLTILYNKFIHVEEGIHINQLAAFSIGKASSVCVSCDIEYNYITNYHRIGVEIQVSTPTNSILLSHNAITDPIAPSYGTYAVSMACCQFGVTFGTAGVSPAYIFDDNVLISSLSGGCPPFGVEFWGNGSQGTNSLIQGTFCNGYTWGFGGGNWALNNNNICGPNFAKGGGYISNEEHQTDTPAQSGNTTSTTCSATSSHAPNISPAGGSFSGSQTVTLADTGPNTGIWYTTDGSTPVPGAGTAQYYTAPFTVSNTATVKAIGMWGSLNEPLSYPAGYGYVPSTVVSASFVAGSTIQAPAARTSSAGNTTSANPVATLTALTITPSAPVLTVGGTTQVKALATYSDGAIRDVTAQVMWKSSDMRTLLASSSGEVAALASGQALLTGSFLGQQSAVLVSTTVDDVAWSDPIVITRGGSYTGNWQSTVAGTPAVTIATQEPVVLENAHIRGPGNLIQATVQGLHLTIRNSLGLAIAPSSRGELNGVFLDAGVPAWLDVENNYLQNVRSGVLLRGYSGDRSERETIVIRGNRARNLNGFLSDGQGGSLPANASNRAHSRFVEMANVQSVPGIDIGWNEVINYPTHSLVSDVIYLYRSSGTPNRPLDVHDTYIEGAYPLRPAQDAYQGGGIMTDGAADDNALDASAFTYIHANQVIATVGYGIAFVAGHDNVAANNRVLASGLLADGTRIAAQQVGLVNASAHVSAATYNNSMHDNLVGWACWTSACGQQGFRHDQYFPAAPADYASNSTAPAQPITSDMEESEYQLWLSKTASAGIKLGPTF